MNTGTESRADALKRLREQHQIGFKATQVLLKELQAVRKEMRQAMKSGPKTVPELAEIIKLPASQVLWHIAAMKKYGLIVETGLDGNYYRYTLAEETKK
jgi:predicted transcriptional regulator